ncbi:MAG: 4-(cytidine 5'-diphospho)-2-C-methyl-D-erythritol kinase [Candidatus Omnitrophota bacterium]
MNSITLTAPAKVNLLLKVLSKRKDGYHSIYTLFERISLADKITISKIPKGIIVESDKFITSEAKDNLVYKAAASMLKINGGGKPGGVKIKIEKHIPIAAGLGGGSSDAASTLIGVNSLYNIKLRQTELMKMGGTLGADVPFFLLDRPFAIGKGRGDDLGAFNCRRSLWHLIVYPGFKLATKDVYEAFDGLPKGLTKKGEDDKIHRYFTAPFCFNSLEQMLYNDLEDTAIVQNKVLGSVIERLAASSGRNTIVSGSGPSVFCLCKTGKEAALARKRLLKSVPASERKSWQVFVARTEK